MRQLHAFWKTAGPGGKHDHCQTLRIDGTHPHFKTSSVRMRLNGEQIIHKGHARDTQYR